MIEAMEDTELLLIFEVQNFNAVDYYNYEKMGIMCSFRKDVM